MLGISGQQEPRSDGLKRAVERARSRMSMDTDAVKSAYKRWAPVYDHTFGLVAAEGRKHAVEVINTRKGRVLEVGVGTGLSLPDYARHLEIVGVDLSPDMLEKAQDRVAAEKLTNVTGLYEMDASHMDFPDASFDTVVAMYVMTVVPDPEKVMRELNRLTKPGGEVLLVNHFSQEEGVRGWVERRMAPFADKIGWKPLFDIDHVMVCDELKLVERRALRPAGLFTMLRFAKQVESELTQRRAA
jgi:phosphatidylethanolamine/phosphatidyl-N-methylethanolamine N-methyltransferase